jgi:hypothetical protein
MSHVLPNDRKAGRRNDIPEYRFIRFPSLGLEQTISMLKEEILEIRNEDRHQALESKPFVIVELGDIKRTGPRDSSDLGVLRDQGGEMIERLNG